MSGELNEASLGEPLELPGGGRVLFTARAHGNLSETAGEAAEQAGDVREGLREQLALKQLAGARQVHGRQVRVIRGEADEDRPVEADGLLTAVRGVGLVMLVADCLPVALGCPGAVAMLHAGWRGLAEGLLEQGVQGLRELGGEGGLTAVIGPGAGVCCYEAGEEVHAAFGGAHRVGRNLDLRAIARERLERAGVLQIKDLASCTICDKGCFSFRREGPRAGRQAGVAWLS
jgi:polyphenol oxidase